ncbi:peptidase C15 [Striga asiatica]|uniref:Peptidase C15 n=1 Tax=Striga asiatica TaxID=4170 RepID=A0A5A7PVQ1_STRAF|nr:peptidase C15 [Striga asiatica]
MVLNDRASQTLHEIRMPRSCFSDTFRLEFILSFMEVAWLLSKQGLVFKLGVSSLVLMLKPRVYGSYLRKKKLGERRKFQEIGTRYISEQNIKYIFTCPPKCPPALPLVRGDGGVIAARRENFPMAAIFALLWFFCFSFPFYRVEDKFERLL